MDDHLNTERAATLLGISAQRLRELTRSGRVPKCGHGRYDPFELVPAYVASLREAAAGRSSMDSAGGLDLVQERAALAKAQRERLEREAALAARELVPAAEVRATWFKLARAARDNLQSIPDRLAPVLASENDSAEVHRLMREEIERTLYRVAGPEPTTGGKPPTEMS
jgi:phage terminase Nu1 subunit (DNA packaging protein)